MDSWDGWGLLCALQRQWGSRQPGPTTLVGLFDQASKLSLPKTYCSHLLAQTLNMESASPRNQRLARIASITWLTSEHLANFVGRSSSPLVDSF